MKNATVQKYKITKIMLYLIDPQLNNNNFVSSLASIFVALETTLVFAASSNVRFQEATKWRDLTSIKPLTQIKPTREGKW